MMMGDERLDVEGDIISGFSKYVSSRLSHM